MYYKNVIAKKHHNKKYINDFNHIESKNDQELSPRKRKRKMSFTNVELTHDFHQNINRQLYSELEKAKQSITPNVAYRREIIKSRREEYLRNYRKRN